MPSLRVSWSTTPEEEEEGYFDLGIMACVGHGWRFRPLFFHAELLVEYEHLFQNEKGQDTRHSSGFAYLGQIGLSIPMKAFRATISSGAGGRIFQIARDGWIHRLDVSATLGFGWKWK